MGQMTKDKNFRYAVVALVLCLFVCVLLSKACAPDVSVPALESAGIMHEEEFGGVYIDRTIEQFNDLGFEYGDSVDIKFSNGYTLEDIPYYNGYYTAVGEPLLVAYPGYPYIRAGINNGDDLWVLAGLSDSDTAEVTLSERGKYASIQNARNISYKDDRELFSSDAVFANFRTVDAGGIQAGRLYRSASPCDNQHNRATYTDALAREAGIGYILDLADNTEKIEGYINSEGFGCPYFLTLYQNGNVYPAAMTMNYSSEDFRAKLAAGLTALSEHEGPYLIHCTEGKDRTGFVCMLLEALCGASYQEIVDDYMTTYDNYYGINITDDKARYDVIVSSVLDPMVQCVAGEGVDFRNSDISAGAADYLRSGGMDGDAIDRLKARLIG